MPFTSLVPSSLVGRHRNAYKPLVIVDSGLLIKSDYNIFRVIQALFPTF